MKLDDFQEGKHVTKISDLNAIKGGTSSTTMQEVGVAAEKCTENEKWSDGSNAGTVEVDCP
ncbi:hypothetical protein [Sinomicrobium sp. M5D2P9]